MRYFFLAIFSFYSLLLSAQDVSLALQKPLRLDPAQRNARWQKLNNKTLISFASSGIRYQQDIPPTLIQQNTWQPVGWKNEKLHTQILVSSQQYLKNVFATATDLKDDQGNRIKSDNISFGFVQYIMTDEFRNGCGYRKSIDFDSSLVADIINTDIERINIQQNTTQPIWITVHVPENTMPGKYKGSIIVKADKEYTLQVALTVIDKTLPAPENWTFRLDYWQHPAAVARVHHVPLWSDEHFNLMRKYYTLLANAGQKIITAGIVDEPWGHQTYDDYPSLIQWTKKKDGSWQYDYSLFDKYIAFVMSCGIKERINCYSMVPWKIAFKYYDEALQKDTFFTKDIGTPEYNTFWRTMLTDFTQHLKQKGWFDITTIAMDERPMKTMQSVIALLKTIDPNWKVSLAGDYHPEIEKDVYDYCIASKLTFPAEVLVQRAQLGKASTWYVCCTEKYPNMFTFSAPDESVWAGWYTAATNMDGFLRWAYNSWTKDPLHDSRFTAWPAGDTYQVYPGPLSSVRFEKLIEGIQDFEKINILRKQYKENGETVKLNELEAALKTFDINELATQTAQQMVDKYKPLLNKM
ncbi:MULTISPECIES: glycoside hydrolase domain-containing protein [Chitinophagaceae]